MPTYNYKSRNLFSGPHLLGVLFIGVGLIALISPVIIDNSGSSGKAILVGAGALAFGLMIVFSYRGIFIDFKRNRMKEYLAFMGYPLGQWYDLPATLRIVVVADKYKTTNTPNGISPTWSGTVTDYKVKLYTETSRVVLSFVFPNKERAIADAGFLAANLKIPFELRIAEASENPSGGAS